MLVLSSTGCQKLKARDQLNKGVQAYKNAKYEQAIDHFQQAVADDPTLHQCAAVPGDRFCPAIHSRRRYS